MTGAVAKATCAAWNVLTAAQELFPYLMKNGVGSTAPRAILMLSMRSVTYCWYTATSSRVPSRPIWPPMKCVHGKAMAVDGTAREPATSSFTLKLSYGTQPGRMTSTSKVLSGRAQEGEDGQAP